MIMDFFWKYMNLDRILFISRSNKKMPAFKIKVTRASTGTKIFSFNSQEGIVGVHLKKSDITFTIVRDKAYEMSISV